MTTENSIINTVMKRKQMNTSQMAFQIEKASMRTPCPVRGGEAGRMRSPGAEMLRDAFRR